MKIRFAIAALSLSACADSMDNFGGNIVEHSAAIVAHQERTSDPIEISGHCFSACTMRVYAGCLTTDAVLVFHGPKGAKDDETYAQAVMFISAHYPPEMASWYITEGHTTTTRMTADEAIRLGVRECDT